MPGNYSQEVREVIDAAPAGPILDMFAKAVIVFARHSKIMVAISGGRDSDMMLDAIFRIDPEKKARYVNFATGMDYKATKRHLAELEEKYGIQIERVKPDLPIPTCCRKYGVPFWSKRVSEYIYRLQRHKFQWEDGPFEVLIKKYPKCRAALRWWCNEWPKKENGSESVFNIAYTPWLKEFMVQNPPPPISAKCCEKAKKAPADKYKKLHNFDLNCTGVRKAEGGARATAYKTCFTSKADAADEFRPIFWFSDADREEYEDFYGVKNSDCYTLWGMDRTGCPGCPYGKNFERELELIQEYEPEFYKAVNKIFGPSYEYTRKYLAFRAEKSEPKGGRQKWT